MTKTLWASGPCRKKGPTWRHGKNRTKNSMEQLTVSWTINYYSVDDIGRRFQALKQDDFSFSLKSVFITDLLVSRMDSHQFHHSFQMHAGIHTIEQQAWHSYEPNAKEQFENCIVDRSYRSAPKWQTISSRVL